MKIRSLLLAFLLAFLFALSPLQGWAVDVEEELQTFEQQVEDWQRVITTARGLLANSDQSFALAEANAREDLEQVITEVRRVIQDQRTLLGPLNQEMDSLGPAPGEGDPPEAESNALLRSDLRAQIAQIDGRIRRAELFRVRATELLSELALLQQSRTWERLQRRAPSPLDASLWNQVPGDAADFFHDLAAAPSDWWSSYQLIRVDQSLPLAMILTGIVGFLASCLIAVRLKVFGDRLLGGVGEDRARRSYAIAFRVVALSAPPVVFLLLIQYGLAELGVLIGMFGSLIERFCSVGAFVLVALVFFEAVIGRHRTELRIIDVSDDQALGLSRWARVLSFFLVLVPISGVLIEFDWDGTPIFHSVFGFVITAIMSFLVFGMMRGHLWDHYSEEGVEPKNWPLLRKVVRGICILAPLVSVIGYAALAAFLLSRVVVLLLTAGAVVFLRRLTRIVLADILAPTGMMHRVLRIPLNLSEAAQGMWVFWLGLTLDLIVLFPLSFLVMWFFGAPPTLIDLWIEQVLLGFSVGDVVVSPTDIVISMALLFAGLALVHWIKLWFSQKMLPNTPLDISLRNSIAAGVGYVGVGIVIMVAISALGIDLSNLALVAGALSVGIGFGLRTVVENFVAGLLLLVSRPIKEGDWINVAGMDGTVRKISVRSTEIETFDRAAVIVPNSELISSPVINWTHGNRLVRIIIKVGVAYGSDVEKVRELLFKCAGEHQNVMSYPAPQVIFREFGSSSLDFELRVFARDTDYYFIVHSDLHFAIDKAFREAGIEIPFPQQDLHLRSGFEVFAKPDRKEEEQ